MQYRLFTLARLSFAALLVNLTSPFQVHRPLNLRQKSYRFEEWTNFFDNRTIGVQRAS
jgi:hypothetical protein